MKFSISLFALSNLASIAYAHSAIGHLLVNGTETGLWQYVLDVAPFTSQYGGPPDPEGDQSGKLTPQLAPTLNTTNITCGRNAFRSLAKTQIADVIAGEEIVFRNIQPEEGGSAAIPGVFYHNGPAQIWMSRAPNDDLKSYKGTGDWFKVGYAGPANNIHWKLRGTKDYNITLPATTPPGAYLIRFELFMPSMSYAYHEWHINCALINVHSPPNTTPGVPKGFLKFPGEGGTWPYDVEDPGLWVNSTIGDGGVPQELLRLLEYQPPGPPVWTG